jgi:hypothetical protein
MSKTTALSVSIALLGGLWAYLALGTLSNATQVWIGFIAWGAFFNSGGDNAALQKTIVGMIYGGIVAGVALHLVDANPLGLEGAVAAAVYIGVTVFFLVIVSGVNLLSAVPANVYGYAATAGLALTTNNMAVTASDLTNPVVIVAISTVLGAIFGLVSSKVAAAIGK